MWLLDNVGNEAGSVGRRKDELWKSNVETSPNNEPKQPNSHAEPGAYSTARARSYRSIYPARWALSSKPAGRRRSMGYTD